MTHAEIEAYNELPNPGDPTQEQIADRSRKIRLGWSDAVRRQREIFHLPAPLKELFA